MEDRRLQFLAQLPLFSAVSPVELNEIIPLVKQRVYRKGEVVYHDGDVPNGLFIVARGAVKTHLTSPTGKQFTVGIIRPGGLFGHFSIFVPNRGASAVALEETELLLLDREHVYAFVHRHSEAIDALLQLMALSRRSLIGRLYDQTMLDLPTRVAKALCRLSPDESAEPEGPIALAEYVTQAELAALVGSTRESVNQCLRLFARQGWIEIAKGRIVLLEPARLMERARVSAAWSGFGDLPAETVQR
jgi:CRP-like cAMP-binding protein